MIVGEWEIGLFILAVAYFPVVKGLEKALRSLEWDGKKGKKEGKTAGSGEKGEVVVEVFGRKVRI